MENTGALKRERLFSKDFILIMTAGTGTAFMNNFFVITLALHINAIGGLQAHTGIIAMVYAIAALIMRPVAGVMTDKYGRVKLLVIGAFICAVTCFLYGLTILIPMLIVIRTVMGIGFGMHSTCAGAAAADILPRSRLAEGVGIFGLGATVAHAVGPGFAIAIVANGEIADFRLLFFIAAGLCTMSTIANANIKYEKKRRQAALELAAEAEASNAETSVVAPEDAKPEKLPKTFLGFEYAVFTPIAAMTLLFIGNAGKTLYLPAFALNSNLGNPALYFAFSAAGVFISRLVFGKVVDRRGADIVVIPGVLIMIAGMFTIPLVTSLPMLVALGFPLGLAQGAVMPTFNALIFRRCSAARRGTASGAFFIAIDLGFAIGSPFHGALLDAFGYRHMFWTGAILVSMSLVAYILVASDRVYNKKKGIVSG